jgi:hypothetical protein
MAKKKDDISFGNKTGRELFEIAQAEVPYEANGSKNSKAILRVLASLVTVSLPAAQYQLAKKILKRCQKDVSLGEEAQMSLVFEDLDHPLPYNSGRIYIANDGTCMPAETATLRYISDEAERKRTKAKESVKASKVSDKVESKFSVWTRSIQKKDPNANVGFGRFIRETGVLKFSPPTLPPRKGPGSIPSGASDTQSDAG